MLRIKFICCDVFARLAYAAAAVSPHIVDLELLPMLAHMEPAKLRAELQSRIDQIESGTYDKLVLGYGLCGNATAGLKAAISMVMPRVHDCCTLFMGSREKFLQVFGENLSTRWCTCGYYERCYRDGLRDEYENYRTNPEYIKLLDEYGEENAEYVWHTLHPPVETKEAVYIKLDGFEYGDSQSGYQAQIEQMGKKVRVEAGNAEWFFRLVNGPWEVNDFLEIIPGESVMPVYDMSEVVRASLI